MFPCNRLVVELWICIFAHHHWIYTRDKSTISVNWTAKIRFFVQIRWIIFGMCAAKSETAVRSSFLEKSKSLIAQAQTCSISSCTSFKSCRNETLSDNHVVNPGQESSLSNDDIWLSCQSLAQKKTVSRLFASLGKDSNPLLFSPFLVLLN